MLGAWPEALAALPADEHGLEVVEIRAMARYALEGLEACVGEWERLHARCAATGDRLGAARAAVMIALFLLVDSGLMAPVRGWLARAERALDGQPVGPVHAMIAMIRGYERFLCGDQAAARTFSAEAIRLGDLYDAAGASVIGQVCQARLLVADGRVAEGLTALDEAGARLMSGTLDALPVGMMLCEIVCTAQSLAMHELAREWTDVMDRWGQGSAVGGISGRCRVHRAELLRISGPGDAAEAEAQAACAELRPWMRREYGWPLVELGNIRLRRGDLQGAEEAFTSAHDLSWSAQPGMALLRLAQGDIPAATALIADAIDHPVDLPWKERPPSGDLQRAPLLDAQSQIAAAAADEPMCAAAAAELVRIAAAYPSRGLAAMSLLAQARAALLGSDVAEAHRLALDAAQEWAALGAPYEGAAARLVAGDARAATGDVEGAHEQWRAAERAFAAYGAAGCLAQLRARLGKARPDHVPSAMQATFRRDGAIRLVRFANAEFAVADLVGFRYLEQLVRQPGVEVAAVDLVATEHGVAVTAESGLPALDDQARQSYRRRLAEVDEDIAEAAAMNDLGRKALAERDRAFLVAELARAAGLSGRIRATGGSADRARTSVYRALRYAIDRLADVNPSLGEHLRRGVRTGTWCSYVPDPLAPLIWHTTQGR
ncbi:MAG: hypothetical protein QOI15_2738 [Pseudonocardiales bacterium]|nr:hypothetical protein [Pseudonocardiales bacterium]